MSKVVSFFSANKGLGVYFKPRNSVAQNGPKSSLGSLQRSPERKGQTKMKKRKGSEKGREVKKYVGVNGYPPK